MDEWKKLYKKLQILKYDNLRKPIQQTCYQLKDRNSDKMANTLIYFTISLLCSKRRRLFFMFYIQKKLFVDAQRCTKCEKKGRIGGNSRIVMLHYVHCKLYAYWDTRDEQRGILNCSTASWSDSLWWRTTIHGCLVSANDPARLINFQEKGIEGDATLE